MVDFAKAVDRKFLYLADSKVGFEPSQVAVRTQYQVVWKNRLNERIIFMCVLSHFVETDHIEEQDKKVTLFLFCVYVTFVQLLLFPFSSVGF